MGEGCKRSPEIECIWADGRGRAWFCERHFDAWAAKDTDGGLPKAIVKQRRVPDGVVGEKYGEYPEAKTAAGAQFIVVSAKGPGQWPTDPVQVMSRERALDYQSAGVVIAGFRTEREAEEFADKMRDAAIDVTAPDGTIVFSGRLLDFSDLAPRLGLRFVDRGRLLQILHRPTTVIGSGRRQMTVTRRAGKTAKATGCKTGDGHSVGLFIPLPRDLAKKFPSLGENDDSPSHVTFLYIGDFKGKRKQERLVAVLRSCLRRWWPSCRATLGDLAYFDHHDKDRRVPHVQVDFDKDMSGFKHRLRQELHEAGIDVGDTFPEYKPHVTLAYMPGMDSEWEGPVPKGSWDFDTVEIWGLPEVHKIKLGPSIHKISEEWVLQVIARRVAMKHYAAGWPDRGRVASVSVNATHRRNVTLVKWLSDLAQHLGVARDTYVVGGAVRNFILGEPIKDVDVVIDTIKAGRDSEWLAQQVAKAIPVPTNVTTNQYGVAILTVKGDWVLDDENLRGEIIEIANARKESYGGETGKGYKPHMVEPATIEEDLRRRDFTVNTLMWRLLDLAHGPDRAEVVDLMGCGRRDLEQRILRCPQDPDITFSDDPTRMLRLVRFMSRYNMKVSPDVAAAVRRNAPKLKNAPWEAIASVLMQTLEGR
jgi:2'-5' RNA ligase